MYLYLNPHDQPELPGNFLYNFDMLASSGWNSTAKRAVYKFVGGTVVLGCTDLLSILKGLSMNECYCNV